MRACCAGSKLCLAAVQPIAQRQSLGGVPVSCLGLQVPHGRGVRQPSWHAHHQACTFHHPGRASRRASGAFLQFAAPGNQVSWTSDNQCVRWSGAPMGGRSHTQRLQWTQLHSITLRPAKWRSFGWHAGRARAWLRRHTRCYPPQAALGLPPFCSVLVKSDNVVFCSCYSLLSLCKYDNAHSTLPMSLMCDPGQPTLQPTPAIRSIRTIAHTQGLLGR